MAYKTQFSFALVLNLESRQEEDSAYNTINTLVTNQGGSFHWKTNQRGGGITVNAKIFLPAADRVEAHSKCNTIESNLDMLPRSGDCIGNIEIEIVQIGLPD